MLQMQVHSKGSIHSLLACLLRKPENVAKEKPEKGPIGLEWVLPTVKGSLCSNQATFRVKVDDDEFDFIVKLTIHYKFIEINVSYDDDELLPPTKMLQYYKAILDHIQLMVKLLLRISTTIAMLSFVMGYFSLAFVIMKLKLTLSSMRSAKATVRV